LSDPLAMSLLTLKPVQIAYHVPDPEAAARRFASEWGWGPFFLMEHLRSLRAQGVEIALEAVTTGGVAFAMADLSASLGHMLELYEPRDDLQKSYAYVKRAAQGWDGTDPVRPLRA
jgi:hypothetical protein